MELFTPELGLIFWMLVPFLIVFIVLAKFAWPAILKGVETRSKFIDDSIKSAKEANERLENIKEEGEKILSEARAEQLRLLAEAKLLREKMVEDAKMQASAEGAKLLQKATDDIAKAKNDALSQIRAEVAALSVGIAEKVMRRQLDDRQQQDAMIDRLLDEMNTHKS
ncbi:MAG: F0F1 ATP synthase subunit B [Prevotellaceae bacterium]|jgi:F-type H+-transporting ATPase subunit b|nr:F0F1 ATP synthase subunit B [Prevotellaceae bacterium]